MTAYDDAKAILTMPDVLVSNKEWRRLVTRMVNEHQELLDDSADYRTATGGGTVTIRLPYKFTWVGGGSK